MSELNSGGVFSNAILTVETKLFKASVSASSTSFELMVKLWGMPWLRLRPVISNSKTPEPGKAVAISFLILSAVCSPINMPKLRRM